MAPRTEFESSTQRRFAAIVVLVTARDVAHCFALMRAFEFQFQQRRLVRWVKRAFWVYAAWSSALWLLLPPQPGTLYQRLTMLGWFIVALTLACISREAGLPEPLIRTTGASSWHSLVGRALALFRHNAPVACGSLALIGASAWTQAAPHMQATLMLRALPSGLVALLVTTGLLSFAGAGAWALSRSNPRTLVLALVLIPWWLHATLPEVPSILDLHHWMIAKAL